MDKDIIIRVRYAETDQMGMVYYANYLVWFEVARVEYLRQKGISYKGLEDQGYLLPVIEAGCTYKRPVMYDEQIIIKPALSILSKVRCRFEYNIINMSQELCAEGFTVHACVSHSRKPIPLPQEVTDLVKQ